jgi:hypothetical protein
MVYSPFAHPKERSVFSTVASLQFTSKVSVKMTYVSVAGVLVAVGSGVSVRVAVGGTGDGVGVGGMGVGVSVGGTGVGVGGMGVSVGTAVDVEVGSGVGVGGGAAHPIKSSNTMPVTITHNDNLFALISDLLLLQLPHGR